MRPRQLAALGLLAIATSLPAAAALIVTSAGQTLGFTASTVATGFTAQSGLFGPFGLTLTGNNQILVNDYGNSSGISSTTSMDRRWRTLSLPWHRPPIQADTRP